MSSTNTVVRFEPRNAAAWLEMFSLSSFLSLGAYAYDLVREGINSLPRLLTRNETQIETPPARPKEDPSKNKENLQELKFSRIPRRINHSTRASDVIIPNSQTVAFNVRVGPLSANLPNAENIVSNINSEPSLEDLNLGNSPPVIDQKALKSPFEDKPNIAVTKPKHICSRKKRFLELQQEKQKQAKLENLNTTNSIKPELLNVSESPKNKPPETIITKSAESINYEKNSKATVPLFNQSSNDQKKMLNELAKEFLKHQNREFSKEFLNECLSCWTSTCHLQENDQMLNSVWTQNNFVIEPNQAISTVKDIKARSLSLIPIDLNSSNTINEDAISDVRKFSRMSLNEKRKLLNACSHLIISNNIKKLDILINQSHHVFAVNKTESSVEDTNESSSNSLIPDEMMNRLLELFKEYQLSQVTQQYRDRFPNKMITYAVNEKSKNVEEKLSNTGPTFQIDKLKSLHINYDPEMLIDGATIPVFDNLTIRQSKIEEISKPLTASELLSVTSNRLLDDLSRKLFNVIEESPDNDKIGALDVNENNSAILTTTGTLLKWHSATSCSEMHVSRSTPDFCMAPDTSPVVDEVVENLQQCHVD